MKYLLLFFLVPFFAFSQHHYTKREIFDFEVGDIFQYSSRSHHSAPYNGTEARIIEKIFSSNNDSVRYTVGLKWYTVSLDQTVNPPQLVYSHHSEKRIWTFNDLDSLIEPTAWALVNYDTSYFSIFCNKDSSLFFERTIGSFEPEYYNQSFAPGLGEVEYNYDYAVASHHEDRFLSYYKKDTVVCGNFDQRFHQILSLEEYGNKADFELFPQPAAQKLNLKLDNVETLNDPRILVSIYNSLGALVLNHEMTFALDSKLSLDVSELGNGSYFVEIRNSEFQIRKPLVILRP